MGALSAYEREKQIRGGRRVLCSSHHSTITGKTLHICERSGERCQHVPCGLEKQIRGGKREQDFGLMGGWWLKPSDYYDWKTLHTCERGGEHCQYIRLEKQIRVAGDSRVLRVLGGCAQQVIHKRGVFRRFNTAGVCISTNAAEGFFARVKRMLRLCRAESCTLLGVMQEG